jgi:hypothetical protein
MITFLISAHAGKVSESITEMGASFGQILALPVIGRS